jgi:hypothetical protein
MDLSFDLFDRLDDYWNKHSGDDIEAILRTASGRCEPIDVRVDLCAADLEWRLRTGAESLTASSRRMANKLSSIPRAVDYRKLLGNDWDLPHVRKQMLEAEWIARSRFGDRPDVDDFACQIPTDGAWVGELSKLLDFIAPLRLSFRDGHEELTQCQVPSQFVIGRANRDEPDAPAWNAKDCRAIVANSQFRSLSRMQLAVRRVRAEEIELINLSRLIPSKLENGVLKPGEKTRRPLPLTIFFTHYHLEISCASDIVFLLENDG